MFFPGNRPKIQTDMPRKINNRGFTLLELLLALGILGVIAVFAVSISHSTRNLVKTSETKNRMKEVKRAVLDYYRAHGNLPMPALKNEVPVAASALNLEQSYRLDAWGRYFHYDQSLHDHYTSRTDITGLSVDGKPVAGVIISGGPDQNIEPGNTGSEYTTGGDDMVLAISVNEQAMAIAMNDLQIMQSKVQAFDRMFAGVDNNAKGGVDEHGCVKADGCPQTGMANDPNCSTATLDAVTPSYSFCSKTVDSPAELIAGLYKLGETVLLDPWLHEYSWGDAFSYNTSDQRYHKFFSAGPNGIAGDDDDIIP